MGRKKKTKEEFIKEATEKHKGKYDYSKVDYVNSKTKVCIICYEHGEFWQAPNEHLKGHGCLKCANEANGERCRSSKEAFIKKARKKHGDKYDYSKVEYVNARTKVCIICHKYGHGEFEQTPHNHLARTGCPKCANEANGERNRLSLSDFIKKANEVHNGKYDYSKVDYVNGSIKVCIIDPEYGEFWQTPSSHLSGKGCPKCRGRYSPTTEEWIEKARKVHGDKYDYYNSNYVDSKTKVCIICSNPEHGEYWQMPSVHLSGKGCPKCGIEKFFEKFAYSKEDFIKKSIEIHCQKYDYSKVDYMNYDTKVRIICPEHGEFWQSPKHHFRGNGCPKCNLSHLERSVMNYLDDMGITYDYQKRFDWLGLQSLDFYLPDYNVGIECQGLQHFEAVDYFGGDKGFKNTWNRDKRKFKKCQKNGIKVLYYSNLGIEYPYDVFEDVDLLFKEIKNIQVKNK
mgnify:CR=1 FL=1